jgi:hypothetical protein
VERGGDAAALLLPHPRMESRTAQVVVESHRRIVGTTLKTTVATKAA